MGTTEFARAVVEYWYAMYQPHYIVSGLHRFRYLVLLCIVLQMSSLEVVIVTYYFKESPL